MHNTTGINIATDEQGVLLKTMQQTLQDYELKIKFLEAGLQTVTAEVLQLNSQLLNETNDLKNTNNELSRIFNQVNEGFFTRDILADKYTDTSVGCEKIYGYFIHDFL